MSEPLLRGEPLLPRVKSVKPLENYRLRLAFTNGEERIFDAKPLLALPVFQPLRNPHFFSLAQVAYGSVSWPNDIDYCPDTLYKESIPANCS